MKRIRIVSCTQAVDQQQIERLMITQSIKNVISKNKDVYDFVLLAGNKRGLPEMYNQVLSADVDSDWLVFVHDDVYIDDACLLEKLDTARHNHGFDIVGAAGCINPRIKNHNLWHVMADRQDHRGTVAHPTGTNYGVERQITYSCFGPTPARVTLIDGLFVAVHAPTARERGWKFNENYTFHHYDMSSCIDANKLKLKIGVYPINLIHTSPGLSSLDDPVWKESNKQFLKEYGSKQ